MEQFDAARFAMSLRIRAAFEHAKQHADGHPNKVAELLVTKLENDDALLLLIARESLKDVLITVINEAFSSTPTPIHSRSPAAFHSRLGD